MPATLTQNRRDTKRFRERVASSAINVDRESGIIRNVKIIGQHSANRRRYTEAALRNAVDLYEGVRVFVNHPTESERGEDRKFEKWAGVLRNVRYREGALFGDLHLRKTTSMFAEICEAAESFPSAFGLSHIANGDSHVDRESGTEIIEAITEVDSVDIVCRPAATAGLFESVTSDTEQQKLINELADFAETIRRTVLALFDTRGVPQFGDEISALQQLHDAAHRWMCAPERNGRLDATCDSLKAVIDAIVDTLQKPTMDGAVQSAETYLDELVALLRNLADGGDGAANPEKISAIESRRAASIREAFNGISGRRSEDARSREIRDLFHSLFPNR